MPCASTTTSGTNPQQHGCANSAPDIICQPGTSIPGQFEMFTPEMCANSTNVISLQVLEDGHSPCASQDTNTCHAGQDRRRVSHSLSLDSGAETTTNDILRRSGLISSASAALQSSLANRLKQRLGTDGSMIYSMRWSEKATPAGRQYCQLVASARRISERDYFLGQSGWPTPQASDGSGGGQAKRALNPDRSNDLMDFAMLAGWPTPTTRDHKDRRECPNVPTNRLLGREVWKADQQIRVTASGQVLTGSDAGTVSSGQLNPEFSLWLMGFPAAWLLCAPGAKQRQGG